LFSFYLVVAAVSIAVSSGLMVLIWRRRHKKITPFILGVSEEILRELKHWDERWETELGVDELTEAISREKHQVVRGLEYLHNEGYITSASGKKPGTVKFDTFKIHSKSVTAMRQYLTT
jgi:predicted transcriptional regulator